MVGLTTAAAPASILCTDKGGNTWQFQSFPVGNQFRAWGMHQTPRQENVSNRPSLQT